jgi:hypothetical protein
MEPIEGSETSDISNQTPGKHPKENILHVKHGESLNSGKFNGYNVFAETFLNLERTFFKITCPHFG